MKIPIRQRDKDSYEISVVGCNTYTLYKSPTPTSNGRGVRLHLLNFTGLYTLIIGTCESSSTVEQFCQLFLRVPSGSISYAINHKDSYARDLSIFIRGGYINIQDLYI